MFIFADTIVGFSKLTIYWHGPFKVLAKLSDVNYKVLVNCGPRSTPQVILVHRWGRFDIKYLQMKTKIKEESENSNQAEINSLDHETQNFRPKRTKQLPPWLSGYDTKWY